MTEEAAADWQRNVQAAVITPADTVFGMVRHVAADGAARTVLAPDERTHDRSGLPAPGVLFLLADSVLGRACIRVVGPDEVIVTSNLHVELYATPFAGDSELHGDGRPARRYQGGAGTDADLVGASGRVASTSGRFSVLAVGSRTGGRIAPPASVADIAVIEDRRGLLDAPVYRTLNAALAELSDGSLAVRYEALPSLANERHGLHGGVGALIGERTCDALIRAVTAADGAFRVTEMRAAFLRPIAADGGQVRCEARIEHLGRRLVAAQAILATPSGAPAVVVDVLAASDPTAAQPA